MDDKNIINILKSDEEKGYELMIHKYTPYISTIVYNMTNSFLSSSDMKEIVADVFFKLWKNRHIIEGDSLKEILIKTTRNTCLDHYKKNKQIFIPLDDDVLQKSNMDTLHSIHEKKEQMEIVNDALDTFGEPDKEIFIRFYYLGEKIRQISSLLSLNDSTIKTKLRRCKEKLKRALCEGGYPYE